MCYNPDDWPEDPEDPEQFQRWLDRLGPDDRLADTVEIRPYPDPDLNGAA